MGIVILVNKILFTKTAEGEGDLSVKNPNKAEEAALREPMAILDEIAKLDEETNEILKEINKYLK